MTELTDDRSAPDRRQTLTAGAAVLLAVAGRSVAQPAPAAYDYLFLDLGAGTARAAFVEHLKTVARARVEAAGGEIVGMFNPQLGWSSTEAAVLVRWKTSMPGRTQALGAIAGAPQVVASHADVLTPTLRPAATDKPAPGGIYVHRWFEVPSPSVAEFLTLSGEGWRDFEARFATKIFGLFTAARSADDQRRGLTRLLLITRYASHGVWEESRDPTTEAMAAFRRRQQLTRSSKAGSSLLAEL